jgi:glycosyltransferase involved in cell wall biosynthesis
MLPAMFFNKILARKNKFITDIRTTPTNRKKFESAMNNFHWQFKTAVKYFHGFSFITPFMEEYIMSKYKLSKYKSVNWSSGVDTDLFNPEKHQSKKKTKAFQLFYHGGISLSRGNLDLIKAVHKLKNEGYAVELLQVGICVDNEIKDYISNYKLESWCKLLPPKPLSEIPAFIAQCDLPILPFPNFMAWRVSSPIKLMEYLAMGKKVLAPNMEAFTDVFGTDSELVFYFDTNHPNQVEAIAEKLKAILDEKILDKGNYFPQARQFVSENYTWEKQSEKLFNFCRTL